ncbi:hypothetical protein LB504_001018 [Fusarium proliferatum]|nr:hypothetical protein LB504_001018 [Fusarium proliferatum]
MDGEGNQSWQGNRMSPNGARSSPGLPSQRRHDESWVEVASQPSSSSLSSIGDEIVTTGLRVGNPYVRRRRLQQSARSLPQQQTAIHNVNAADLKRYQNLSVKPAVLLASWTVQLVHDNRNMYGRLMDFSYSDKNRLSDRRVISRLLN